MVEMPTYEWIKKDKAAVFLGNKRVGNILRTTEGWRYYPKGSSLMGEPFPTLPECFDSLLESDDD